MAYLLDTSAWVALAIDQHPGHEAVKSMVLSQTEPKSILFCRATQQSFLRLLTTAAIFKPFNLPPLSNKQAWEIFDAFELNPSMAFVGESAELSRLWKELSGMKTSSPKVWMDAYLAAFAISHGHTLVSFDADFKQFSGLAFDLIS